MRYVKRTKKAPASLSGQKVRAEIAAARRHFHDKDKAKSFDFQAYKSPDIKQALLELFDGKCAYCEEILSGQPGDVEHYRPKSEISDGKTTIRPGYYWLAAEWTNLLPSCRDCNGERMQEMVDIYRKTKAGKGNQFPVLNGSRLKYPSQKGEKGALLDPCSDDPSEHLAFPLSRQGVVIPRKNGQGGNRATETIRILGLNRKLLVQARRTKLSLLMFALDSLRKEHAAMTRKGSARSRKDFLALRAQVRKIVTPDHAFTECLRQAIEETIASLR
jgi:uncharacterized protein (TIGR02646 family)